MDNNKIHKALFIYVRPLYVTDMRYFEFPEVNVSFCL